MDNELRLTQEKAAEAYERFVRPVAPGAFLEDIELIDETGRLLNIGDDPFVGGHAVYVLAADFSEGAAAEAARGFVRRAADFEAYGTRVFFVTASSDCSANLTARRALASPFPILADVNGAGFAVFGLNRWRVGAGVRTLVVSPLRQVRAVLDAPPAHAASALDMVRDARAEEEPRWSAPHAPVLAVPHVLSLEECRALIGHCESVGALTVSKPEAEAAGGDYKMPVWEYGRQDRTDHVLKDETILRRLDQRLFERVIPQIARCFAFEATRREVLHVARYEGTRAGMQMGHRDNRTATFYRRFALSLNLNDDYEGGGVVFREFSPRPYKSPAGTALVFSSALLHEVEETTRGVRYTLISHFFNERTLAEAAPRGGGRA